MFSLKAELTLSHVDYEDLLHFLNSEGVIGQYALNYLRYRLRSELPTDDQRWTDILHYESRHSLLDIYDTFLILLCTRNPVNIPDDVKPFLSTLGKELNCGIFQSAARYICLDAGRSESRFHDNYHAMVKEAFNGHFDASLAHSLDAIADDPRFFCAYNIAALSAAHLENDLTLERAAPAPSRDVLEAVSEWYRPFANRIEAMEKLRRLARFHSGTPLGWGIQNFVESNDGEFTPLNAERIPTISSPVALPVQILNFSDEAFARSLLASMFTETAPSFLGKSLKAIMDGGDLGAIEQRLESESLERRLHISAILAAMRNEHAIASDYLSRLRLNHATYYAVRPDVQLLEATELFEVDEIESAAAITAKLYAINPQSVPPKLLQKFGPLVLDEDRNVQRDNIAWPIIATALRNSHYPQLTIDRVHDFVSDYIEANGCTLPTELLSKNGTTLSQQEIVFMQECCTADIMESSIWIGSKESLFKERLALCETIRAILKTPPTGIEGEIGLLMRKLAVLDITQRIERSRIYVDTDRIKERLPDSLTDTATRLLAIVAISNREVNRSLKLLGMPNREGGSVVLVAVDRGQELFGMVFERIREQYLFSPELGLDANLSQSIRHGPIITGIRSIFDKSELITRKSASGEYQENKQWQSSLNLPTATRDVIGKAFSQLAASVDAFIQNVRMNEIQIVSKDTPNGLLNYEFTEQELEAAFVTIEPFHDVEDIFDIATGLLISRTEQNLQRVRARITSDWEQQLLALLGNFMAQVDKVVSDSSKLSALRTAYTDCCTEIPRSLEKIAAWFAQEDKHESKAFTVRSLVKTFEQMALKGGQRCVAEISGQTVDADRPIAGVYFRSLWDLFFILFDNAIKHGGQEETEIEVTVELSESNTRIVVANRVAEDHEKEGLAEKISQLNAMSLDRKSDLLKLRSEGGSGIAKLHKIARYEIGNDEAGYSIQLELSRESKFQVVIALERGICDEDFLGR